VEEGLTLDQIILDSASSSIKSNRSFAYWRGQEISGKDHIRCFSKIGEVMKSRKGKRPISIGLSHRRPVQDKTFEIHIGVKSYYLTNTFPHLDFGNADRMKK
jgi:hypothetical protein